MIALIRVSNFPQNTQFFQPTKKKREDTTGRITYHLLHKAEGGGLPRDPDVA
jgi:hypothetical protein